MKVPVHVEPQPKKPAKVEVRPRAPTPSIKRNNGPTKRKRHRKRNQRTGTANPTQSYAIALLEKAEKEKTRQQYLDETASVEKCEDTNPGKAASIIIGGKRYPCTIQKQTKCLREIRLLVPKGPDCTKIMTEVQKNELELGTDQITSDLVMTVHKDYLKAPMPQVAATNCIPAVQKDTAETPVDVSKSASNAKTPAKWKVGKKVYYTGKFIENGTEVTKTLKCKILKMYTSGLVRVEFNNKPRKIEGQKLGFKCQVPIGGLSVQNPQSVTLRRLANAEPASPVSSPALAHRRFLTAQEILDCRRRRPTSAEVVLGRLLEEIKSLQ